MSPKNNLGVSFCGGIMNLVYKYLENIGYAVLLNISKDTRVYLGYRLEPNKGLLIRSGDAQTILGMMAGTQDWAKIIQFSELQHIQKQQMFSDPEIQDAISKGYYCVRW
jgi:hypothetical protein